MVQMFVNQALIDFIKPHRKYSLSSGHAAYYCFIQYSLYLSGSIDIHHDLNFIDARGLELVCGFTGYAC
jgi:hypothetical protein